MQKGAFIGIAKYAIITYPDGSVIEVPTIERAAQVLGVKSVGTILRAGQGQAFRFDRLKGITVKVGERYVINERTKKKIKTKKKLTKTTRRIRRGG